MKKKWISILAAIAILGLSGCGGSGSSTTPAASGAALPVTTISGTTLDMAGVWVGTCYSSAGGGSPDWQDTATFTGQTIKVVATAFPSTNLSCSGTPTTEAGTISADLATSVDETITGWVFNAGGVATAPTKLDTTGPISGTASFTKVTATITAATGTFGAGAVNAVPVGTINDLSHVVDDTGAKARAYNLNYAAGASTAKSDDFSNQQ